MGSPKNVKCFLCVSSGSEMRLRYVLMKRSGDHFDFANEKFIWSLRGEALSKAQTTGRAGADIEWMSKMNFAGWKSKPLVIDVIVEIRIWICCYSAEGVGSTYCNNHSLFKSFWDNISFIDPAHFLLLCVKSFTHWENPPRLRAATTIHSQQSEWGRNLWHSFINYTSFSRFQTTENLNCWICLSFRQVKRSVMSVCRVGGEWGCRRSKGLEKLFKEQSTM